MTLADFKNKIKSTLSSIYESDELNSIFYLLSEEFLQIPRSKILLADEIELDSKKQILLLDTLDRLTKNEPVQYVLGKATFMGTILKGANLTKADLTDADLRGALLRGHIFCETKMPDGTLNNSNCD